MNSVSRNLLSAITGCAALIAAGCSSEPNPAAGQAELAAMNQQLAARVQRLEDMLAIQKVQAKYTHLLFTQDFARIVDECFAEHSPDVSVEFSDSGVYRGLDHIRALYAAFEETKKIPGFFILHAVVTPYIEIAADGQSAKAHWLSPGAVGNANSASWVWGPYYADYVKEDGEWRILHTNLAALFRNRYEVSWAKAEDHGTVRGILPVEPDEPSTIYRPYNELKAETDIFKNHPDLPAPY